MNWNGIPRVLQWVLTAVTVLVAGAVGLGLYAAEGKPAYELVKDLLVPMVGPLVAVVVPVTILFVLPGRQNRERLALELCNEYYSEEMRIARNIGWRLFVTEQRALAPTDRSARLNHFLDYLTNPEVHRGINPEMDEQYQRVGRVLDYFALVDECVGRGTADGGIVRSFIVYYYLWWRDEIMEPLRKTRAIPTGHPKFRPVWWATLKHLDAMGGPEGG